MFKNVAGLGLMGTSGIGIVASFMNASTMGAFTIVPIAVNSLFFFGGTQLMGK